jgi:hypothetical protein
MAVRCGAGESSTEADPEWLKDLPKPGPGAGRKPQPETVPAPPAKANENSGSALGSGFNMRPQAVPASANAGDGPNGGLGEGFQLQPRGKASEGSDENAKPALKGLEAPAEQPSHVIHNGGASSFPVPADGPLAQWRDAAPANQGPSLSASN